MLDRYKTIRRMVLTAILATGMIFTSQVQAHGGLALADDMCVLTVGPYRMHFTGYQPLTQEEEFCEDIPEIGKTVIALDYINEELRPFETEVRIVRSSALLNINTRTTAQDFEKLSAEDLESITIYHTSPKVYPSASIMVDHTFSEKGSFAGVVTVSNEGKEFVSVFPFSVGEGRPISWITYAPIVLIVAGAAFFFMRKKNNTQQSA